MKFTAWLRNHFFEVISDQSWYIGTYLEKFITIPNGGRYGYSYMYWQDNIVHIWLTNASKIELTDVSIEEFIEFKRFLR